ncbi:MAG: hemolysin III family protein [Gammaproteobacteria bacterium]|nr:hemolysin III family protein [Gammaproteobacteria bacterium]MBU1557296.1 hemolysin III family protein [Gammaproteobacteria bacterium]MBU2071247.1 hemolysin III family protein [Gammaproteobacteria bacterium]MBU2181654.1 hemolysin III family protein [Gammaproteobacteria bacterium]MBU2205358.1 hemolysin III family protein [Gammaproteobacteria bacterium]
MTCTPYSPFEELLHALSHGIGALLSILALVLMLTLSVQHGDSWYLASSLVYGSSLILLYSSSTLYHAMRNATIKRRLRQLDHAAIFILIAGTYTPFTLINLRDNWGLPLFGLIWAIAIAGVIIELATGLKYKKLSLGLYLGMGWMVIVAIQPMLNHVASGGLLLLLSGGLCYSLGVIFYIWKRLYLHHVIWHLFVLGGSVLHFFAIYYYVLSA